MANDDDFFGLQEFCKNMTEEERTDFFLALTSHSGAITKLTDITLETVPISKTKISVRLPMKKWYKSKTLWVNIVIGLAGMLEAILNNGTLSTSEVSALTTVYALINIVLRAVTKEKLTK